MHRRLCKWRMGSADVIFKDEILPEMRLPPDLTPVSEDDAESIRTAQRDMTQVGHMFMEACIHNDRFEH